MFYILPSSFLSRLLNVRRSFFSWSFRYLENSLKSRLPSLFWSPEDTIFCKREVSKRGCYPHISEALESRHDHALWEFHANVKRPSPATPPCTSSQEDPHGHRKLYLCGALAEYAHRFEACSQFRNVHLSIFVGVEPLKQVLVRPLTVGIPTPGSREEEPPYVLIHCSANREAASAVRVRS